MKKISVSLIALFISVASMAQSFSQSDLIGTWALDEDSPCPFYLEVEITDSLFNFRIYHENKLFMKQCYWYYLSDDNQVSVESFNYSLVNRQKYGKYMLCISDIGRSESYDDDGNLKDYPSNEINTLYVNILGLSSHHLSFIFSDRIQYSFHR